jgi:ABC-2 type transport system ATP-binding protein
MTDTTAAVEVIDLRRTYPARGRKEQVALDSVSLRIPYGQIHGVLGPNGAGKTTLCKILSTVLLPTSGRALVCGLDVAARTTAARRKIGVVFGGDRGLYTRLTAQQNLHYWAALCNQPRRVARRRSQELLERVGLADRARTRVETFSRGMRQRLHLARGLIADPEVLFLDEPTVGMDPVAAHAFREVILGLKEEGRTVLLTTHDMAEAEAVCDQVTLIADGRLLATEDPRTIGSWITTYERIEAVGVSEAVADRIRELPGLANVHLDPHGLCQVELGADDSADTVIRAFLDEGITQISTHRPSLQDVYLHVFGDRQLEIR